MENRLEYVDIAKGVGIMLVVWSHSDALDLMWLMMGMFVPIFYFCSGYTFSMKGTLVECMRKRFRKLFIPYLFFNLLMFCAFMHFSLREIVGFFYSRYSFYPLDVNPNIKFLTSGNYPMWFLTSMIVSYLFFYLLVYFNRFKYLLFSIYLILTIVLDRIPILLPWSLDTAFLTALFMYAGMVVRNKDYISVNWWQVGIVLSLYISIHLVGGDNNLSVRMYGTSVFICFVLGCLGCFVVLWGARFLEGTIVGRIFLLLGQHSLTIFCIEIAFIVLAKDIYMWVFPNLELGYLAGLFEIILALAGGLVVSVLLHQSKTLSRVLL